MDWLLNHPLVLFIIAAAVANFVQKMKKAGAQQRPPQPTRGSLDPDTAERTRRVQEEIRRKIAERAGRLPASPPPMSASPAAGPSSAPPARNVFQELARQMAEAKRIAELQERAQAAAEAQSRQRLAAEQETRELAEARRLAEIQRTEATAVVDDSGAGRKTTDVSARDKLLASLREPDSLRRAFVLREILGEPVGLR